MSRTGKSWLTILVAIVVLRLVTLAAYPLADTTEARYSEIARLMVVSGDWITPQIELGIPFWAKPPLSIWLTAASFEVLGINEFAARLPSFLLTLLTTILIFKVGQKFLSKDSAMIASGVFLSSVLGFVVAGAVQTDASLLVATTISMLAFFMAVREPRSSWRYVFFVGLAIGLLAKGPIAVVLTGVPILIWSLWFKNLRWLSWALPWFSGSLVVLAIAGPWYWLAETRTPGFLNYFIIGEHWLRFVESGWQGDLYGSAHAHSWGSIWLYGIAAAMPWTAVALFAAARSVMRGTYRAAVNPQTAFLMLWMLTPLVFFTFAGNILATYVLPGLPAFALLLGDWLAKQSWPYVRLGWIVPVVILAALASGSLDRVGRKSERDLIAYHAATTSASDLHYYLRRPFSASFYSSGQAGLIKSSTELSEYLATGGEGSIAMRKAQADALPMSFKSCLRVKREIHRYLLMEKQVDGCGFPIETD